MYYIQILITLAHHLLNLYVKNQQLPIETFQLLKWGIDNEKNAVTQYTEFQKNQGHKNFKVNNCGLFLYRVNSFLGASPDSISQCSCHSEKNCWK